MEKKQIYINTFITFALCFLTHFLYDLFPNALTALLFPVNESIWEHMKMLYSTIILYGIIMYFIKGHKIPIFLFSLFIKAFIAIPIYLLIYLPIYYSIGENMFISIFLLLIVLYIVYYIGWKIENMNPIKYGTIIGIIGIILGWILMGYLTYYPPKTHLFLDTKNEKYGIREYIIH